MPMPFLPVLLAAHLLNGTGMMTQTQDTKIPNAPPAAPQKWSEFDKPETFAWVRWKNVSEYAQKIPTNDIGSATLYGEAVGCFGVGDKIMVTNPRLLAVLKAGLENAQVPDPPAMIPGVAGTNALTFYAKPGKKPFGERAATFTFQPWWPSLSFGPRFWEALKAFSRWYTAQIRANLLAINPRTINRISLEYTNDDSTELTKKTDIGRLLRAANTLDHTAYDVTDKNRLPVRMVVWTKNKSRWFYLLVRVKRNEKNGNENSGAFSQIVSGYAKNAGYWKL